MSSRLFSVQSPHLAQSQAVALLSLFNILSPSPPLSMVSPKGIHTPSPTFMLSLHRDVAGRLWVAWAAVAQSQISTSRTSPPLLLPVIPPLTPTTPTPPPPMKTPTIPVPLAVPPRPRTPLSSTKLAWALDAHWPMIPPTLAHHSLRGDPSIWARPLRISQGSCMCLVLLVSFDLPLSLCLSVLSAIRPEPSTSTARPSFMPRASIFRAVPSFLLAWTSSSLTRSSEGATMAR